MKKTVCFTSVFFALTLVMCAYIAYLLQDDAPALPVSARIVQESELTPLEAFLTARQTRYDDALSQLRQMAADEHLGDSLRALAGEMALDMLADTQTELAVETALRAMNAGACGCVKRAGALYVITQRALTQEQADAIMALCTDVSGLSAEYIKILQGVS